MLILIVYNLLKLYVYVLYDWGCFVYFCGCFIFVMGIQIDFDFVFRLEYNKQNDIGRCMIICCVMSY